MVIVKISIKLLMKSFIVFLLFVGFTSSFAQTATNTVDEKGLKQGFWIKLNPQTGKPAYKGTFKDDKPIGVFKYYYSEIDTIHTIMDFRNNGKIGYAQIFYMTGTIQAKGKYINEKKDSVWTFYDENGKLLSTENYKEGKKEGKSVVYYPSGSVSEEKNYKNDLKDGEFKQYFEGKKIKAEGTYVADKFVGKNAFYYPNGMAAASGFYNDKGNRHGVWVYRDKDGKITSKDVYDNGKVLTEKEAAIWLEKNKGKEPKETTSKDSSKGTKTNSGKSTKNSTKTPSKGVKK